MGTRSTLCQSRFTCMRTYHNTDMEINIFLSSVKDTYTTKYPPKISHFMLVLEGISLTFNVVISVAHITFKENFLF